MHSDHFIQRCVHLTKGREQRLNRVAERRWIYLRVWSQQEATTLTSSPDRLWILHFSKRLVLTASTAFNFPPENLALCAVAMASSVYIVSLIACIMSLWCLIHPSLLPQVCAVNVIRDSASCPWWARAVVFTCTCSISPDVGQRGAARGLVRSCMWMISPWYD